MTILPITLVGDNLGKRHRHLNNIVNEAFRNNVPFESVRDLGEHSPIDRIFKIDLAAKYRYVDYILLTLKDEDMLYVSRAMKSLWLLQDPQYSNIMNPVYLEQELYPEMLTTASNKMKHWILLNLKHKMRCQEFYEYYKKENIDFAVKFLPKCSVQYLLKEMEVIPTNKITAQILKLLCEQSPKAGEFFFKKFDRGSQVSQIYITSIQMLLKTDPEIYFYVIESFFLNNFKRLNEEATKYIMIQHRDKFEEKSELYAARILNLTTLAKFLSNKEIKELLIRMSRARDCLGIRQLFNCERFNPLIKRSNLQESFIKKIFTKLLEGQVQELTYFVPSIPVKAHIEDNVCFYCTEDYEKIEVPRRAIGCCLPARRVKPPTALEKLLEEYKFKNFKVTFAELRKRLLYEKERRQDMLLVLVHKAQRDNVDTLLQFLVTRHMNELPPVRGAILRSLVLKAAVWRVSAQAWELLLQFSFDQSLDGTKPDTVMYLNSREGIHAVVLRHILNNTKCHIPVWKTFLVHYTFSPLTEYPLNAEERRCLKKRMPELLVNAIDANPDQAPLHLTQLLDTIIAYGLRLDENPRTVELIADAARRNQRGIDKVLRRLFDVRVARKLLIKEYFPFIQTDASYLNVLRHDPGILAEGKDFTCLLNGHIVPKVRHERFLRKLALYFGEEGGLAVRYLGMLENKVAIEPYEKLARPIALLTAAAAVKWPDIPKTQNERYHTSYKNMMTSLRFNKHLERPKQPVDLSSKNVNLAAAGNWIHTCSRTALRQKLGTLVLQPRLARLTLALRPLAWPGLVADTLPSAARRHRLRVFRTTLRILRRYPQLFHDKEREYFISLASDINLKSNAYKVSSESTLESRNKENKRLLMNLFRNKVYGNIANLNGIPRSFIVDYSVAMFPRLVELDLGSKTGPNYRILLPMLACISDHLDQIDARFIQNIIRDFMEKNLMLKKILQKHFEHDDAYSPRSLNRASHIMEKDIDILRYYVETFLRMIARFVLIEDSVMNQQRKLEEVLQPFLEKVRSMWNGTGEKRSQFLIRSFFYMFLKGLNHTKIFLEPTESSYPILEKVKIFCDEISLFYKNFGMNYAIQLIIIYRNAVKQSVNERPELFRNKKLNSESSKLLAFHFGKAVAEDIEEVVSRYFMSVTVFYCNYLEHYLQTFFCHPFSKMQYNYFIRGLIHDENKTNGVTMGMLLHNKIFSDLPPINKVTVDEFEMDLFRSLNRIEIEQVKFFSNSNTTPKTRGFGISQFSDDIFLI